MTLVEDRGGMRRDETEGDALGVENTDTVEPKRLCGESWVHPYLRQASVDPKSGSGLDILV